MVSLAEKMDPIEQSDQPKEESLFTEADFSMKGYDKPIRNARTMLFVVAGIELLGILGVLKAPEPARTVAIVVTLVVVGVFVALALWTKKKPYTALLVALIFYISLLVLAGILNPVTIVQGVILKIITIVLLILGLRNGKEAQDLKETFGNRS
jgi:hypothetical protein